MCFNIVEHKLLTVVRTAHYLPVQSFGIVEVNFIDCS